MTRDDIIRMAREADLSHFYDSEGHCSGITDAQLVTKDKQRNDDRLVHMLAPFAALVAAAEREACARVADKQDGDDEGDVGACTWSKAARHIATAIRARS